MVWKATTAVGCGRERCDGRGGSPGWFVVCEYYPPGNVRGGFGENVQERVAGRGSGAARVRGGAGVVGVAVVAGMLGWMVI